MLTEQLARFKPTKVAVEMVPTLDTFAIAEYEKFIPAALMKDRSEIVQIGFRLANRMKHHAVFVIKKQSDKLDYFPFDTTEAYARANVQDADLAALKANWAGEGAKIALTQPRLTVSKILAEMNEVGAIARYQWHDISALSIGRGNDLAGAELNAAWSLRNAKIHAKLMKISQPGDRIVLQFSAGHSYWLREFVRTTPGFVLAEPCAHLR